MCSASSNGMIKCAQAGLMRALSPNVSDHGKQAAAALIKPYVSGLERSSACPVCHSIITVGLSFAVQVMICPE